MGVTGGHFVKKRSLFGLVTCVPSRTFVRVLWCEMTSVKLDWPGSVPPKTTWVFLFSKIVYPFRPILRVFPVQTTNGQWEWPVVISSKRSFFRLNNTFYSRSIPTPIHIPRTFVRVLSYRGQVASGTDQWPFCSKRSIFDFVTFSVLFQTIMWI